MPLNKKLQNLIYLWLPPTFNPPFGYLDQNDFLNGIIALKTNLVPNEFLKNVEARK